MTPYRCCVIYGQLPPETRSKQARLFNDRSSGYDILVASDAIGMGLNLNIRRIIFHSVAKYSNSKVKNSPPEYIVPSAVKQIAGRAGRMSSNYKYGEVTAWQEKDLAYINAVMQFEIPQITRAGIFPSVEQIQIFADLLSKAQASAAASICEPEDIDPETGEIVTPQLISSDAYEPSTATVSVVTYHRPSRLSVVLEKFVESAKTSSDFFICDHEAMIQISNWLYSVPISLTDMYLFALSPVAIREDMSVNALYEFASSYASKVPVPIKIIFPSKKPTDLEAFTDFCARHNVLDLYIWLSFRFPSYFVHQDKALLQAQYSLSIIQNTLESSTLKQIYSHAGAFRRLTNKIKCDAKGFPLSISESIRQSMIDRLKKIDRKFWYVLTENDDSKFDSRLMYNKSNSYSNSRNIGANDDRKIDSKSNDNGKDRNRIIGDNDDKKIEPKSMSNNNNSGRIMGEYDDKKIEPKSNYNKSNRSANNEKANNLSTVKHFQKVPFDIKEMKKKFVYVRKQS